MTRTEWPWGISPEECLRGTGVEASKIYDASTLTSVRQYAAVCSNALLLSRDPSTPFQVGARLHLFAYGMYGYALMSCLSPQASPHFEKTQ